VVRYTLRADPCDADAFETLEALRGTRVSYSAIDDRNRYGEMRSITLNEAAHAEARVHM